MFYHNLVNRQWRMYNPPVPFPSRDNLYKPERDFITHDRCYDCRRELEIHLNYLIRDNKKQAYDDKLESYDAIDELSLALRHRKSLYYKMHGMFTSFNRSMEHKRNQYRKYIIERKQKRFNRRTFNKPTNNERLGMKII